ncbi:protein of unknown function [Ectopseudomonas oleovorans]|nr:protein of unknown function [Pseudomonas oleovorans]
MGTPTRCRSQASRRPESSAKHEKESVPGSGEPERCKAQTDELAPFTNSDGSLTFQPVCNAATPTLDRPRTDSTQCPSQRTRAGAITDGDGRRRP